ncbi:MAG: DMT family transporter [Gammaproteobacteria bacterium]|nr:DMT family transporter [Gammaproteobacteria bacterium]
MLQKSPNNIPSAALIGIVFTVIAALAFSSKAIAIKLAYGYGEQVSPIILLTLRMAIALPFFLFSLYFIERKYDLPRLSHQDIARLIALGLVGFYLAAYLDFVGLSYITASLERLILLLYPSFVVLITALLKRKKISLREAIALGVSYIGFIIVFAQELSFSEPDLVLGSIFVFGSALAFAIYFIGNGALIGKLGAKRCTAYAMTFACIATNLHFATSYDPVIFALPAEVYGLALFMALVCTVLPTFFMAAGIQRIGANSAAIISSLGPIMTLVLAYFFLNETLTPQQMAGATLVVIGVFVVTKIK